MRCLISVEKNQVALMIAAMLKIDIVNILLDSTDALAIAICHAQKVSNKETAEFLTHRI